MAMVQQEELTSNNVEDIHISEEEDDVSSRRSSESMRSKQSTPGLMPQHQYSKEELMKIAKHPLSQQRPSCLNPAHNNSSGKWDPERWFVNKRGDKEEIRSKRERSDVEIISHKRRTSDPKERIKEEKDDIVLSPQRRSFGTGCHVTPQSSLAKRPGSPTDGRDGDNFREPTRRIGSGRIMNREREQREWERDHREFTYNGRGDRRDRFDQDDNDKEVRRYSGRYGRDRRMRGNERIEEEPEWFSSGPTSQSETIELVGFDDVSNEEEVKKTSRKSKRNRENSRRQNSKSEESEKNERPQPIQEEKSVNRGGSPMEKVKNKSKPSTPDLQPPADNTEYPKNSDSNFNLDDLLKLDWIPGFLPNETPSENTNSEITGSRFSQWFKRESPELRLPNSGENSRRSSLHDELIANIINEMDEPHIIIPSPVSSLCDNYFAPISPALSNSNCIIQPSHNTVCSENFMGLLQSVGTGRNNTLVNGEKTGKENNSNMKSVKELEADLKRIVLGDIVNDTKVQEDKSAFEKLLQHISDTTPSSISMGPLDKSKALQEDELLQNILGQNSTQSPPSSQPVKNEKSGTLPQAHPGFTHQYSQPSQLTTSDLYNQLFSSQRQQQPSSTQLKQQLPSQQRPMPQSQFVPTKQGLNTQCFTVDMLAKMLDSQSPLSPITNIHPTGSMTYNRTDSQPLNAMQQQQKQREFLNSVMKQQQQQQQPAMQAHVQSSVSHQHPVPKEIITGAPSKSLGVPNIGGGISPRHSPLSSENIGSTLVNQGRIPSPLVFGQQPPALSHAPAPIHPAHVAQAVAQNAAAASNTLQVQNIMLQRVPSPQELAVHTQSILQNALIKRKLEEQKENFRKRQEAQRASSPITSSSKSGTSVSPMKGMGPSIPFTPTSVMRKMHSEKSDNSQIQKNDVFQNGGNRHLICNDNRASEIDQNNIHRNGTNVQNSTMNMFNNISSSSTVSHHNNGITPRPVYGQSNMNHPRPQHLASATVINSSSAPSIVVGGHNQGRAIVKGGNGHTNINPCFDVSRNAIANKTMTSNKHFISSANQYGMLTEQDVTMDTVNKLLEQQRLLQHHKSMALLNQRRQATSPMPPIHTATAAAYAFAPHGTANLGANPNLVRPINIGRGNVTNPNINYPLLRTVMQANPTLRASQSCSINPLTALGQLAALQMQRGVNDTRQLQAAARNYSPLALQQLFNQSQVAAQAQVASGFTGAHGDGKHHLHPGQPPAHRQSPVNLTKWFGNDVLKQKMPEMPPVSHQKALRLEDVERQHSTAVHN